MTEQTLPVCIVRQSGWTNEEIIRAQLDMKLREACENPADAGGRIDQRLRGY